MGSARLIVFAAYVLLGAGLAGCGNSPTRPTPVGPAPTTSSTKTFKGSVWIEGLEPLPGARVEITAGTRTGLSTTTDETGRFELPEVAGVLTLQFTHEGYSLARESVDVDEVGFLGVSLAPVGPVLSIAGTYTLTMAAAPDCGLPAELKTRRYTATVTQDESRLKVSVSDATFRSSCPECVGSSFEGYVAQDRVAFFFQGRPHDPAFDYPSIIEVVGTDQLMMFHGKASAPPGTDMVGTFSGDFQLVSAASGDLVASCSSERHQFTLKR